MRSGFVYHFQPLRLMREVLFSDDEIYIITFHHPKTKLTRLHLHQQESLPALHSVVVLIDSQPICENSVEFRSTVLKTVY